MKVEFTFAHATQVKEVISHKIYEELIKPSKDRMYELSKIDSKKLTDENKQEIADLKSKLEPYNGIWCTDESPYGLSVHTGVMILPANQGGEHPVKIRIIEE